MRFLITAAIMLASVIASAQSRSHSNTRDELIRLQNRCERASSYRLEAECYKYGIDRIVQDLRHSDVFDRDDRRERDRLQCYAVNTFGKHAQGGGCNTFGCYYPGGGCNTFGCYYEGGSCNTFGCIKEAPKTKKACND